MIKKVKYKNNIFEYSDFEDESCVLSINGRNYGYICIDDFIEYAEDVNFEELTKEIYNYIQEQIYFYGEPVEGINLWVLK